MFNRTYFHNLLYCLLNITILIFAYFMIFFLKSFLLICSITFIIPIISQQIKVDLSLVFNILHLLK